MMIPFVASLFSAGSWDMPAPRGQLGYYISFPRSQTVVGLSASFEPETVPAASGCHVCLVDHVVTFPRYESPEATRRKTSCPICA